MSTNPIALRRCIQCPRGYAERQLPRLPVRRKFLRGNPIPKPEFRWGQSPESPDCRNYCAPRRVARSLENARTARSSSPAKIPASKCVGKLDWPWKGNYTGRAAAQPLLARLSGKGSQLRNQRNSKLPRNYELNRVG